mgnify:CR=1 FL=1
MTGASAGPARLALARSAGALGCVLLLTTLVDVRAIALALPLALTLRVQAARIPRAAELGAYLLLLLGFGAGVCVLGETPGGLAGQIAASALVVTASRAFFVPTVLAKGGDVTAVLVASAALAVQGHRVAELAPSLAAALGLATLGRDPTFGAGRPRVAWGSAAALMVGALCVGGASSRIVPRATFAVARRFAMRAYDRPRSGFDDALTLGDAQEILESDKVVLRLTGDDVEYLRGKVYQSFDGAQWLGLASHSTPAAPSFPAPTSPSKSVHVEATSGHGVLFAPLGFVVPGARTRADGLTHGPKRTSWDATKPAGDGLSLGPPSADDLQLPRAHRDELRALAAEWTVGAATDAERLEALETHLRGYRYTLRRERFEGSALRDFLFVHRAGHCELFATAFALLARASGIPARVIGGYRVAESAPSGPGYVVRERHAHAWVEAYSATPTTPAAWRTWDPTPPSAFLRRPSPLEVALLSAEALLDGLGKPKALVGGGVLVAVGVGVWLGVRRARARRARLAAPVVPIHPELERLEAHLATRGVQRDRAEGLYAFAERLETQGDDLAARAVRACAALRYGHEGTSEELRALVSARLASDARA